jgi:hypothetical protein
MHVSSVFGRSRWMRCAFAKRSPYGVGEAL